MHTDTIIYVFITLYGVCLFIDTCERTTNQLDQKILNLRKKVLFGWSEGTALLTMCIPCIHYTEYKFTVAPPLKEKKGCPPDPLHPSLDTGMGKTYIIILFLSNLHIMHSNVPALILNQNCNIVPNLHTYNFPNNLSLYLTCFMFLFFTNVPNSCMHIAQCTYGHLHCLFLT